jgi:hypothetical protein
MSTWLRPLGLIVQLSAMTFIATSAQDVASVTGLPTNRGPERALATKSVRSKVLPIC